MQLLRRSNRIHWKLLHLTAWTIFVAGLVLVSTLVTAIPSRAAAGINPKINYQGRLLNAAGAVVPDGTYNFEFKMYTGGTGCVSGGTSPCAGTSVWTEDWVYGSGAPDNRITVRNGYFSVALGSLTSLSAVDFNNDTLWLSMNVGNTTTAATFGAAAGDGEMLPFKRLASDAYAMNSNMVGGLTASQLLQLAPTVAQADASTNNSLYINKTAATGNILDLQRGGSDVLVVANDGSVLFQNKTNSASVLAVKNQDASLTLLRVDAVNNLVVLSNNNWLSATDASGTSTVNILKLNANNEIQVGAALNVDGSINLPTDGGQVTLSDLPISSSATAGTKESYTMRVGSTNALTVYGEADGSGNAQNLRVAVGTSIAPLYTLDVGGDLNLSSGSSFRIAGTAICTSAGCTGSGGGSGINNSTSIQASANFAIQALSSTTNGTVGGVIRGAAGGQTVDLFQLQNTGGTVVAKFDASGNFVGQNGNFGAGLTVTGTSTFNNTLTVATGQGVALTGGATGTRPGTIEGTIYYDTTTKSLLTYANSKWQGDRSGVSRTVAASTASQFTKDGADYVTDGETSSGAGAGTIDGDQIEINNALTAVGAAGGGTVYLTEGTFTIDAAISIPNNVTLAGSGNSTLIQLGNFGATSTSVNMIVNTTTASGTGVSIRDLKLDGRRSINTSGTQAGIVMTGIGTGTGATTTIGATISRVNVLNTLSDGIDIASSSHASITNGTVVNTNGAGINVASSSYTQISGMGISGNANGSFGGIYVSGTSTNTTISGNKVEGNFIGIFLQNTTSNSTVSGNTVINNTVDGILARGSGNTISANVLNQNGTGIEVLFANYSTVTGNTMKGNTAGGVVTGSATSNITISANTMQGAQSGIRLDNGSSYINASGNTISSPSVAGIYLNSAGANSTFTGNTIQDPGGATAFNAIYITSGTSNVFSDNQLFDSSCSTTCYAINITDAASTANIFTSNKYTSTSGTPSIQNLGTGTIFNNQFGGTSGTDIISRTAASTTAFQIQNAGGTGVLTADSITGTVTVNQGSLIINGLANPTNVTASTSTSGGTLAAGVYKYLIAAKSGAGETQAKAPLTGSVTTTGSTSSNTISWTAVPNATGYAFYRSTDGGTTWFVNNIGLISSTTDTGSSYTWSTAPVAGRPNLNTNTTGGIQLADGNPVTFNNAGTSQIKYDTTAGTLGVSNLASGGTILLQSDSFGFQDAGWSNYDFQVNGIGQAAFKNRINTSSAFIIQYAGGVSTLFDADTLNGRIGIGTITPTDLLDVRLPGNTFGKLAVFGNQTSGAYGHLANRADGTFEVAGESGDPFSLSANGNTDNILIGLDGSTSLKATSSSGTAFQVVRASDSKQLLWVDSAVPFGQVNLGTDLSLPDTGSLYFNAINTATTLNYRSNDPAYDITVNSAGLNFGRAVSGTAGSAATMDYSTFLIDPSGKIGVGTSLPGYKLDVQGGDINASGNVRVNGTTILGASGLTFGPAADATITGNAANSLILNAGVNTTSNRSVQIGALAADGNQVNLTLDNSSTFAETANTCTATVNDGALYYNSNSTAIRACIKNGPQANGSWEDVVTTAGLGIMLYGVVPDSGTATGQGDLVGAVTASVSGPCKVSASTTSTTQLIVQPCTAYSGGRKVSINTATTLTLSGTTATTGWAHVCFTAAGAIGFIAAASQTASLPTFSISNPLLCIADVSISATANVPSAVYDVRTFTTSMKEFMTGTAAVALGTVVVPAANGAVSATAAAGLAARGVVVGASSTSSATTPFAIVATSGPTYVKATAGTSAGIVQTGATTAGYVVTAAASATAYANLGYTRTTFPATACTAGVAASPVNCDRSLLVNLNIR